MAEAVNIRRDVKDGFYRYQMPSIVIKYEGKGNGKKTVLVNIADVAKSLARPPSYLTKFFGFELGAMTTMDEAHNRYVINGFNEQSKLAVLLDDFIERFILCKQCERNPETFVLINDGLVELKCKACGGRTPIDMRHKISTYIVKNPPPKEKPIIKAQESEDQELVKSKSEERVSKKSSRKKKEKIEDGDGDDDDVVWQTDTSKEAAEQRRKDMLDNTSELAAKLLNTDIAERPDPLANLRALMETNPSQAKFIQELKKERQENKLNDEQTARLAFLALFDAKQVYKQVKSDRLQIIQEVVTNTDCQKGVLAALTELGKDAAMLKVVSHVLKHLYDEDVLEEEPIVEWYNEKPKKKGTDDDGAVSKVKEAAATFVNWLETASSDEDEEEDDDEDD